MTFKSYPKIERLGKEETDGILFGEVHIEEKIDGANVSIWVDKRGDITCGSRNRELTEGFNGFVEFVKTNDSFKKLFEKYPNARLYGEWLVRHTIPYNELSYKKFYLFDITTVKDGEESEQFEPRSFVHAVANEFGIPTPQYHGVFTNPTVELINEFVGKSSLGDVGEGVVIKNEKFTNKFGDTRYAKVVTQKFKEDNAVVFGGNNKFSETYWEMYVVNKYMTLARIEKIMNKIQPLIDRRLDLEHIPRVAGTAYHDMITEEIWEIVGKVPALDFRHLKRLGTKKAIQIYKDIILGDISVADKNNEQENSEAGQAAAV